eukprot:349777-Chlamydomonas_euryale.AAC.10
MACRATEVDPPSVDIVASACQRYCHIASSNTPPVTASVPVYVALRPPILSGRSPPRKLCACMTILPRGCLCWCP